MTKETIELVQWLGMVKRLRYWGVDRNKAVYLVTRSYGLQRGEVIRLAQALK